MIEHVSELRRLREKIERRNGESRIYHADQQPRGLVTVVQHQGDFIVPGEPLRDEITGEFDRIGLELRVCEHAARFRRDQIGRGGLCARLQIDVMPDGAHEEIL